MMRKRSLFLGTLALGAVVACTVTLGMTLRSQQTSMWCWAASGQMVMEKINAAAAPSQCVQANNRFGFNNCCTNVSSPNNCVRGGWPEFSRYGFSSLTTSNAALAWDKLRAELISGRPIAFSWHWNGGGGHMMVAEGFVDADAEAGTPNMVEVLDPWPPNVGDHRFITYEAYVQGSGYTHWNDYYNVQYVGR